MLDTPTTKRDWRVRLLAGRMAVPAEVRAAEAKLLTAGALAAARGTEGPVCGYLPVGAEPGSIELLDTLRDAGHLVLLPVVPPARGPLDWAPYRGAASLADGPYKLLEPTTPRLGPSAVAGAGLMLLPALAVDHLGVRLGRGAGWYDRTLPLAAPGTRLVAVVRDDELVPRLPVEPHDAPMNAALTPHGGVRNLPLMAH